MEVPDTFNGMFWGYLVLWLLLTIYMVSLGLRVKKLESEATESKESGE